MLWGTIRHVFWSIIEKENILRSFILLVNLWSSVMDGLEVLETGTASKEEWCLKASIDIQKKERYIDR